MIFDEFRWSKSDTFAPFACPKQRRRRDISVENPIAIDSKLRRSGIVG
jgi:hypothetical protein